MWHMPHGIDLPATPKSNYNCYLLYEQPSLARIHSFTHINFYCCKRLLGRNNTATTSAPHERCNTFSRVLYYSPTTQRTPDSSCTSSYRRWCPLLTSWQDNSLGSIHLACIHLIIEYLQFSRNISLLAVLCSSSQNFCLLLW